MYSKEMVSRQKQAFWTAFGKYMKPVLSADGEEISWINYKTGISGIGFKMEADNKSAGITIDITINDERQQELFYKQFLALKNMLQEALGEDDWHWQPPATNQYGKVQSSISKTLPGINVMQEEDWPAIISFLKPRIITLDEFWSIARYSFEALG